MAGATEQNEEKFKEFINSLLEAQSYDFMNEKTLFTRSTLEKTLVTFCDIIAKELKCDSCDILLQLYDPKMVNEKYLKELVDEHLNKTSKPYSGKNENEKEKEKEEKEKKEFENSRKDFLMRQLTFPYWAFPKGAASLVAVNRESPWLTVFNDKTSKLGYIHLIGGVTKEIFQEDVARIRDRLSIIETRNFRKLGYADPLVWNNTEWKYVFKNYYGVPIRIHSGGEVIGLLKVENKKEFKEEEIKNLLSMPDSVALAGSIINKLKEASQKLENFKSLDVSLLALAYLEADLNSKECSDSIKKNGGGLEKIFFIPYPDYITEILKRLGYAINNGILEPEIETDKTKVHEKKEFIKKDPLKFLIETLDADNDDSKKIFQERKLLCDIFNSIIQTFSIFGKLKCDELKSSKTDEKAFKSKAIAILDTFDSKIRQFNGIKIDSLIPFDKETRPPMQLFTKSIEEEKRLWELLGEANSLKVLYRKVKTFYDIFNEAFSSIDYRKAACDLQAVEKILIESVANSTFANGPLKECRFEIEDWSNDFHFKVSLNANNKSDSIVLYVVLLPTKKELNGNLNPDYFPNHSNYRKVNKIWLLNDPDITVKRYRESRENLGWMTLGEFVLSPDSKWITDFLMDRLAVRMQALTLAFPVAEFTFQDTNKLTWAAFEIGKLIEREISYRANRHDDPMPLTAMEFYRIPISDLSFVDDMRNRRNDVKRCGKNIDVYLNNIIFELNMKDAVEYSSRIKDYKSYFERIGERFEGYTRGNIALWVFLLSLIVGKGEDIFPNNIEIEKNAGKEYLDSKELFLNSLNKFKEFILGSLDGNDSNFFNTYFTKNKAKSLYGDFKFDSPPFIDEENWRFIFDVKLKFFKKKLIKENENVNVSENLNDIKSKLFKAFNRIMVNLKQERVNIVASNQPIDSIDITDFFSKNQEELNNLLFRDYSFFKRDSVSLLIQIANLLRNIDKVNDFLSFKEFYKKCRELREFLCSTPQQIDDGKKEYYLRKIFGMEIEKDTGSKSEAWRNIKDFINKYNTEDVFGKKEKNFLPLNPKSIYKRIRMLNNVLHHQISSAFLDWELSRFDLYGTRMNCLFKNQVFALFEKIWNKGDAFFFYEPSAKTFVDYYQEEGKPIDTNRFRQRWLCLRANLMQGEYNACQIATLIDPKTIEPAYWENISSYNLKSLQYVLGEIFIEFEEEAAKKYRCYSWHRRLISDSYCQWYKYNANIFQDETRNGQQESEKAKWFGSFLFEGVINLLMLVVSSIIDYKNDKKNENRHGFHEDTLKQIVKLDKGHRFNDILERFFWVVKSGVEYSNTIKKSFSDETLFSNIPFVCHCKKLKTKNAGQVSSSNCKMVVCSSRQSNGCALYINSIIFLDLLLKKGNLKEKDNLVLNKIKSDLERERDFFTELKTSDSIEEGFQIPLFFFDEHQISIDGYKTIEELQEIKENLKALLKGGGKLVDLEVRYCSFIYRTLMRIRREQKSYLFDKGNKSENYAGLWMRDKNEVLGRIKNYALLFSKEVIDKENKEHFCGWNAHDLYYYIHSLIPMEIQVRTELTNTFAVQYHDNIYKLHPPVGTVFPHSMIKDAGENLDKIDREMEIDYEDYTLRYPHRSEEGDR